MKKCPVCGVEHSDIITVCSICGSPLTGAAPAESAAPADPAPSVPSSASSDFSADDIQAAVSSVVSATVDEHKSAASVEPEDFDDDSPFVVNAMRDAESKKPSAAAREVKTPSRSSAPKKAYYSKKVTPDKPKASEPAKRQPQPEKNKAVDPAVDTTAVAAVSAQKVYEATQNAINARNAQAAASAKKPEAQDAEQIEWSQRKHKRKDGSNGAIIAACALVLLLIIAILIFVFKMVFGGDSNTKPADDSNNTVSDDSNPGGDDSTEGEQGDTTILPEQDADGEGGNTEEPADTEDPDANTPDDDNNTEDPDASVIDSDGDADAPANQPDDSQAADGSDTEEPVEDDNQPVVVPTELPAITEANDTVYATAAVNVRDYPSAQTSNVINVLSAGQAVKRTGTTANGWSRVDLGNGTVGYVSNSYLSASKDGAQNNNNNSSDNSVAYAGTDVNVRSTPGGDVIAALSKGTEVKLTGTVSGNWTQITAGNITGYVYTSYLNGSKNSSDHNNTDQPKVTVKETGDTVYATSGVNVRDYPSSSTGNVVATLTKGQEVKRIGTTASGWSQVKVGDITGYVYSGYLSTSKDGGSDNSNHNNSGNSKSSGYILPDSGNRNYTKDELSKLSKSDLRLARNEIYARHGRKFNDESLRKYFEGKSWYSGTVDAATFDANISSYLNSYELANLKLIQEVENS